VSHEAMVIDPGADVSEILAIVYCTICVSSTRN